MTSAVAGPDALTDALFTVADRGGVPERLSLSTLLARLLAGPEVSQFSRIAAEQRGYWWRFIVRCAAKALHDRGQTVAEAARHPPSELAIALRDALRTAAGDPEGTRGVWLLHQPDPAQPGFLQHPVLDGAQPEERRYSRNTTSLLTCAIGSKSHERKTEIARELDAEQLVYGLIELQLGAIFGGRGNYGSQIMGSAAGAGSGSPFMGARLGSAENETFRHDVSVLLDSWERIRGDHALRGTIWSLWTEPWNGESSLPSNKLDPAFIPLARSIRVDAPRADGAFHTVWFRASSKSRVEDLTGGGNLGDPFTPLVPDAKHPDKLKVRGTLDGGYGYLEVTNLLFGTDSRRPGTPSPSVSALIRLDDDERADVRVLFEGAAFEQGKTVGFHRREVLLHSNTSELFGNPAPARAAHGEMLNMVRDAKSALRGAVRILLSGTTRPREGDDDKIALPTDDLDASVDRIYLDALLDAAVRYESEDTSWRIRWARHLEELALKSFDATAGSVPTATSRQYERQALAKNRLEHRLRVMRSSVGDSAAITPSSPPEEVTA